MNATRSIAAAAALCLWIPQASAQKPKFSIDKSRKALAPITYKNLTLFPVVSRKANTRSFTVLDKGMKAGKVKVLETSSVNNLTLVNKSDQPLFLMAGEVVIGGKQDRIIGKNTIVPPRTKETIPVYCVEHGRWAGRKTEFRSAGSLAHTKLRKRAAYADQSAVWKEVASKNAKRKEANSTQTYRRVATGKKTTAAVAGYERHFRRRLSALNKRKDVVGFVVALGGRVVAVETFRSNTLFRQLQGKLLRSYFVEAVDQPATATRVKTPGAKEVRGFLAKAKAAPRKTVHAASGARTYQFKGSGVVGSMVTAKPRRASKKSPAKPAPAAADDDAEYRAVYAE